MSKDISKKIHKAKKRNVVNTFLRESNKIEEVYGDKYLYSSKKAWEYVIQENEMTPEVVKKTHGILMKNHTGNLASNSFIEEKHCGEYRDCAIYIGGREGAPFWVLPELVKEWCEAVNGLLNKVDSKVLMSNAFKVQIIKEQHIRYEGIHPFIDGNGRTGRVFLNWTRVKAGLPILIIEAKTKYDDYYPWFQ